MGTIRKWRSWEFPNQSQLQAPTEQEAMRDWLAGMGTAEMRLWQMMGGWIPPELIDVFEIATTIEARYSTQAEMSAVRPVEKPSTVQASSTVGSLKPASAGGGSANAA